jgi:hypothetical protein
MRYLVMFAFALSGCATRQPIVQVKGECADAFQAQVCSWANMQGKSVLQVGVMLPVAAIENAPNEDPMAWPPVPAATVQLPDSGQQQSGLT